MRNTVKFSEATEQQVRDLRKGTLTEILRQMLSDGTHTEAVTSRAKELAEKQMENSNLTDSIAKRFRAECLKGANRSAQLSEETQAKKLMDLLSTPIYREEAERWTSNF